MNLYVSLKWLEEHIKVVSYTNMWRETETDEFVSVKNIHSAPSIDIVHCIECRYKGMEICPMYKLTKAGVLKPYDFCSYGEKENNEGHN